jgi:hypothetical protein
MEVLRVKPAAEPADAVKERQMEEVISLVMLREPAAPVTLEMLALTDKTDQPQVSHSGRPQVEEVVVVAMVAMVGTLNGNVIRPLGLQSSLMWKARASI